MGKLISVSTMAIDSTIMSPSVTMGIQEDRIKFAQAATTAQKAVTPGVNSQIHVNWESNNAGENHILLVNESVSTIVSGS